MKYLDEFRDPKVARKILAEIKNTVTQPWVIMEICGGQTNTILKHGIDQVIPKEIELVHGPGCPVCVTPLEIIDKAIAIALQPNVIFTSFGDMLRVPGSNMDLFMASSEGADVRTVYSPLEVLKIARDNPDREVVFFAVGFETTAPGNAMAIHQAKVEGLTNFSELASHVLVPPAMEALLSSLDNRVQGYLAAGHVCTIMGWEEYEPIA
ncbi:MAG: hydrogenase formation protein HypD, partial [Candidatus Marinimicrobia bacterium]|nr:hydrogenase formation protein HypD [Candidatus Neomarinimicrobiota bacterium]